MTRSISAKNTSRRVFLALRTEFSITESRLAGHAGCESYTQVYVIRCLILRIDQGVLKLSMQNQMQKLSDFLMLQLLKGRALAA